MSMFYPFKQKEIMTSIIKHFIAITLVVSFCSCSDNHVLHPMVKPDVIMKSQENFTSYWAQYLRLPDEFTAYDSLAKKMDKEEFFSMLRTGKFLPLRMQSDSTGKYMLYRIHEEKDPLITTWLQMIGNENYHGFITEGKPLPKLDYTSIDGKPINSETIKNKILVLNFWFIHCQPCVAEIPELNEWVDEYGNEGDFIFAAIAFDSKKDLLNFNKKHNFKYHIVSDTGSLQKALGINGYPTHVIVNRDGTIMKIFADSYSKNESVSAALKKMAMR